MSSNVKKIKIMSKNLKNVKNVKNVIKCKKILKSVKMSKKDMIPRPTTDDDDSQVHDRRVLRYTTSCTYRRHNDSYRVHILAP